ncbi:MAG: hypothetical protein D6689_15640 [Deltaproteobacteria bacterium]|nr:MAG: hypothetical protein D6689_15640 [Deltaproteobacteria bacterium]
MEAPPRLVPARRKLARAGRCRDHGGRRRARGARRGPPSRRAPRPGFFALAAAPDPGGSCRQDAHAPAGDDGAAGGALFDRHPTRGERPRGQILGGPPSDDHNPPLVADGCRPFAGARTPVAGPRRGDQRGRAARRDRQRAGARAHRRRAAPLQPARSRLGDRDDRQAGARQRPREARRTDDDHRAAGSRQRLGHRGGRSVDEPHGRRVTRFARAGKAGRPDARSSAATTESARREARGRSAARGGRGPLPRAAGPPRAGYPVGVTSGATIPHVVSLGSGVDDAAVVGGKAAGLERLLRAGLPVPPGVVLTAAAYRARTVPRVDLRGRLAVRSSATVEDGPRGAAAGLFDSVLDVAPEDLEGAVRRVWASADSPAVAAYLEARGLPPSDLAVAVVVQPYLHADERGTLYSRLPDDPAAPRALVERAGGAWLEVDRDAGDPLMRLARAAERALGCDGVDIEWLRCGDRLWIVQARPIPAPVPAARPDPALWAFSAADPDTTWRWDVTHNPDPLSPAQIGLVDRVNRGDLRVVAGYLYAADRPDDVAARPAVDVGALDAMERELERTGDTVASALATYEAVYRIYNDRLAPGLRAARRALPALLAEHVGPDEADALAHVLLGAPSDARLESLLVAVAEGRLPRRALEAVAAPMAPAWDVAVPTYGERPDLLDAAIAAARRSGAAAAARDAERRVRARLPPGARAAFDAALAEARAAADVAELDDRLFARAQWQVRRALLALGRGDDAFFVPLDAAARGEVDPAAAAAARAQMRRQRGLAMPLAVRGGRPLASPPAVAGWAWRGRGCGGRARGVAVVVSDLGAIPQLPAGAIVVADTITPAMAVLLCRARAVVAAHGGLLDHGAAIARELGVPCVVGCAGARRALRTGDRVFVDGAAGWVVKLRG